jgi:hypothetical protein
MYLFKKINANFTTLANNPYIGKSCMLHIHMVFKLNLDLKYASNASTPFHNIWGSSIKGCKYTSTLLNVHDSFLGMINDNTKKYLFVTSHGGRLI